MKKNGFKRFKNRSCFVKIGTLKPFIQANAKIIATIFFLAISQYACFDPQEGCLDIAATNFNASADKDCCCRYPNLILSVDQVYGTQLYRQDSLYAGAGGHLFRIKSIVFYLSDFQLFKSGQSFELLDSLVLKTKDAMNDDTISQTFIDDFTLIRRTPLDNIVGSFREDGDFDKIRFRLGLSTEADNVIPALAPTSHPLRPQTENLLENNHYVFLQAVVVRDSQPATLPDTLNFSAADLNNFFIQGDGLFRHNTGYDFPVKLKVDWSVLFQDVIWTNSDISSWKSQIVANLPSVFSVSQ